ncbi:MAG: TonB-dependent receptor [Blastocatellia bacterium]|nr:TonB-dependent receptor [Blastocatellia bacterium]
MTRLFQPLMAVAFLLLVSASTHAQSETSLIVTVTDQNKAVIAGADVKILNTASGRTVIGKTDSSGSYNIEELPPGLYRISVTSEGFATAARSLALHGGEPASHTFSLVPGSIEDTITVTAGKGIARAAVDVPQTTTVTDASDIESRRPASTLDVIGRTPNLNQISSNPAAERPRLRGLSSSRVLIVIDGERLNNVRTDLFSGISPSVMDVTELQSAEVVSGAGSSLYGSDAMAGTINLISKTPLREDSKRYLGVRFDGDFRSSGPFGRGAATLNWSVPRFALRISGSRFRTQDYTAGDSPVLLEDVVRLGRFATEMANSIGNNVAVTYAVWSLKAQAEIPNGQGHGFNGQIDLWFFPSDKHSLRYRELNSQHKDIGLPLIVPPFEVREQFNGFRRLDKYGVRYEGRELADWLPRVAGGFYRQKYSFADDNFVSTINEGSSWAVIEDPDVPGNSISVLTGRPSTFTLGSFTDGKNAVTSYGLDLQASFIPHRAAVITTGLSFLEDSSVDEFSRVNFISGVPDPGSIITGRASNPDSVYKNIGWFNLFEYEPRHWLRLTGGIRLDNWRTEAKVTDGFPLGTESAILDASLAALLSNPGPIDVDGLNGIADLVNGARGIKTDNTIVTSNIGVVVRAPGRVNPYFRWGNSYREPGITERYILRDFGDPTFSVLLVSNTNLKPERGHSVDAGIKVQRDRWHASLGYFRNNFEDFFRAAFSDAIFVPADPSRGLAPLSPDFPFHGVLYVQRTNTSRVRIQGVEGYTEASVPLTDLGTIMPFGTFGWLKGSDLTPDPGAIALINRFYNRADTPLKLKGSAEDAPLSSITPFRAIFGARYNSIGGKWFGEYEVRYQARVERADPLDLTTNILTQYGTLASLDSLTRHAIRGGYTHRRESYRLSFVLGVENLTDRFYFEHFQNAPGAGRSFLAGVTLDFLNLLRR